LIHKHAFFDTISGKDNVDKKFISFLYTMAKEKDLYTMAKEKDMVNTNIDLRLFFISS
jgi:hypothetical protein